ncbi:hypothetical protein [Streptomyces sp. NPDC050704]|uniref:hypothetical protein n=1 Tax=Streptomyces sp. NPDC050704 TaxID=3157219 RepID=UPI00343BFF2F
MHQVALRDNLLRVASGLRLFDVAYVPWLAGLRTTYRTEPSAGKLTRWCEDRLDAVLDVRTEARRGKPALVPARPDGHVDWIARDALTMRARLTDLFRPLLGARQDRRQQQQQQQRKEREHTA